MNKIADICDYINLMTYDFGYYTHNANLYPTSSSYGSCLSCDESVNLFMETGVPAYKINLGISSLGLYGNMHLSYETLVNNYIKN